MSPSAGAAPDDPASTLRVARRFRGPDSSGNGGYTAGVLSTLALSRTRADPSSIVEVTLRRPPPLDVAMTVSRSGPGDTTGLSVSHAGEVVAQAVVVDPGSREPTPDPVGPVSVEVARTAEAAYAGLEQHPFPHCFVCGTARTRPDALALRPGRWTPGRTACVWTPDAGLAADGGPAPAVLAWAAMDCPAGWTADTVGRPMVLGRMTASVSTAPRIGVEHVVVGALLGNEGRKTFTASALYDADGTMLAQARHVWLVVDPHAFG